MDAGKLVPGELLRQPFHAIQYDQGHFLAVEMNLNVFAHTLYKADVRNGDPYGFVVDLEQQCIILAGKFLRDAAFIKVFYTLEKGQDASIDTDSSHTTLKSLTYDRTLSGILGVGYKFSF